MFTGLIEDVGRIERVESAGPGRRLHVASALPADGFALGDSVAVDGVCLTVTSLPTGGGFTADASHETIARTTLGSVRAGTPVNLERALRLSDRLGGHLVTGHVDASGALLSRRRAGEAWDLTFEIPRSIAPQVVDKGSIAVGGVSLTVNRCRPGSFGVTVIPHTGRRTTLLDLAVGAAVNIETDVIGKYVAHLLAGTGGGAPAEAAAGLETALRRQGFL